jgi:hypothetical protein
LSGLALSPNGAPISNDVSQAFNAAITPWMNVTTDLQIVDSGLNRALSLTTPGQLDGIDPVVVLGSRLRIRF